MKGLVIVLCCASVAAGCGRLGIRSDMNEPQVNFVSEPGEIGAICGDAEIIGRILEPIEGAGACGIENPVEVLSVAGIALENGATVNCDTASAFAAWTRDAVIPNFAEQGGGLTEMRVAASYACRTRNHRPGARLSEHSFGNAIDISAFTLADGEVVTVLEGWSRARESRALRAVHEMACGIFGTVLGPGSDGHHEDHFHFDVADYRSGPYCR